MAVKFRKGDRVQVISGKDKGKQGDIVKIVGDKNRVVVGGVNMALRHTRRSTPSAVPCTLLGLPASTRCSAR